LKEENNPKAVCAYKYSENDCNSYTLDTYISEEAALSDGAFITHYGHCGLCSTARDLSIYLQFPNLTKPGKRCALKSLTQGDEVGQKCFEDIGFSKPCA